MTQVPLITLNELLASLPDGAEGKSAQQVRDAYAFACEAHAGRRRKSGELYIEHDLAVAQILLQLGVDINTIAASLLHDSLLSHTGKSEDDIQEAFGSEVASLVSSLNNLYAYSENKNYQKHQEENGNRQALEQIRHAILTIIEGDIRVILIRMADCLQDLRKANALEGENQQEIAAEAMNIYAPLANRLGVWQLKWELEDLAFRYLNPERYREIAANLAERRVERTKKINRAVAKLEEKLEEMNFHAIITGRPKHIYSIHRKMERKNVDFEHIYDIYAVRIILGPVEPEIYEQKSSKEKDEADRSLCYQVLGAVHGLWQPIPREFDDYIASPKPNGYKSLHTAVIDDEGDTLEVQIRTMRMHEEAEKGIAAHWAYKEGAPRVSTSVQKRIQNLRELLSVLRDTESSDENGFLETEILAERIHVFTPRGDVIDLPAGSTPIDFAYRIHTQVGHRCRGARVNGKMVSLDYKLNSGEKVEILTAKREGPSRDWMNPSLGYTGSAQTRSKVRRWFRQQEREKNIQQGREVVERELKRLGLSETYTVADIAEALKYQDIEKFLANVGFGDIQSTQISGAISLLKQKLRPDDEELRPLLQPKSEPKGLTVRGLTGLHTRMAGCCNPIPPEPIIGYVTRGHGVTVHRQDCKQVQAIDERERLIEVGWGLDTETYPIPIVVQAYRRPGLLDDMINLFRGQQINVPSTKTTTSDSMTTIYLIAEVTSLEQLNWLLNKLENLPNVIEAHRQRWT